MRNFIIDSVSENGGHFGASLGVVELTVALHYVFNTPKDLLVWDVGHQAYGHKILTGRKKGLIQTESLKVLVVFLKDLKVNMIHLGLVTPQHLLAQH